MTSPLLVPGRRQVAVQVSRTESAASKRSLSLPSERHRPVMSEGVGNGGDRLGKEIAEDSNSGSASIPELVEQTFVMAAASGSYEQGLRAFIQVIGKAYESGYTVPALTMEVSFVPTKVCRVGF